MQMKQKQIWTTDGIPDIMNNNSSNVNFGATTHVYFYTNNGNRIISPKNMRKCERYLVRQLNGAKNLKTRNEELVDTFKAGDYEYKIQPQCRSFYERAKGLVNIITGKDKKLMDSWGKEIGKAKRLSKEVTGSTRSFETKYATDLYNHKGSNLVKNNGIYRNGERQAFGICFEPVLNKKGELKEFKYVRSAWFNESKVK